MRKIRKITSCLLAVIMTLGLFAVLPLTVNAANETITSNTVWADGKTISGTVTISGGTESNPIIITVAGTVNLTNDGVIEFGAGAHVIFRGNGAETSKFVENSTQPALFLYHHPDDNVRATIRFEKLTMNCSSGASGVWFRAGAGAPGQVDFTNTVITKANTSAPLIYTSNCFVHFHSGTMIINNSCYSLIKSDQTSGTEEQFVSTVYIYDGCEISGNTCTGMYLLDASLYGKVVMYGGTIKNNTVGANGSLISIKNGIMDIYGGSIENNISSGYMIDNYQGTLNIYDGSFSANTAANGGVLLNLSYVSDTVTNIATANIYGGTFFDNTATSGGGAIWNNKYSVLNIYGGTFAGNTSSGNGGAVYSSGVLNITPTVTDYSVNGRSKTSSGILSITGNTAANTGGGVAMGTTGELTLGGSNITIAGNTSTNDKGTDLVILSGNPFSVTSAIENSTIKYSLLDTVGASGAYTAGTAFTVEAGVNVSENSFQLEQEGFTVGQTIGEVVAILTIYLHSNFGSDDFVSQEVISGQAANIMHNPFTNVGYRLVGWNTVADGSGTMYPDRAQITLTATTNLYAQWVRDLDINEDAVEDVNDIAFIISASAGEVTMTEAQAAKADLNGDGAVDGFDAAELDRYVYSVNTAKGDVNQDGEIDLADYAMTKAHISGVAVDNNTPANLLDKSYLTAEYDSIKDNYPNGTIITQQYYCADYDGDKAVDAFDLFYLDKRLNNIA